MSFLWLFWLLLVMFLNDIFWLIIASHGIIKAPLSQSVQMDMDNPVMLILLVVIIAPLLEEFIFRFFPLSLTFLIFSEEHIKIPLLIVVIGNSVIFGLAHGHHGSYLFYLLTAGIFGLMANYIFLRVRKKIKKSKQIVPWITCSAFHGLYNLLILIIIFLT